MSSLDAEDANMSNQASLLNKLKLWWNDIPIVTRTIFALCTSIFIISNGLIGWDDDLGRVCLALEPITLQYQFWRLISAPLFHAGILHIGFNMLALLPIGAFIEKTLGQAQFTTLIIILIFSGDFLYLFLAFFASFFHFSYQISRQCAVGFSGVIFGLIPVEIRLSNATQRSIFGLIMLPAAIYPWALLVFWQILVPQSSFLGHLSGLAIGEIYVLLVLKEYMNDTLPTTIASSSSSSFSWGRVLAPFLNTNRGGDESLLLLGRDQHSSSSEVESSFVDRIRSWFQNVLSRSYNNNSNGDSFDAAPSIRNDNNNSGK